MLDAVDVRKGPFLSRRNFDSLNFFVRTFKFVVIRYWFIQYCQYWFKSYYLLMNLD